MSDEEKPSAQNAGGYTKLNGEQIDQMLAERAEKAKTGVKRRATPTVIRAIIAGLLLLASAAMALSLQQQNTSFEAKRQANIAMINKLSGDLDEANKAGDSSPTSDHIADVMKQIQSSGGDVAGDQNAYYAAGSSVSDIQKASEDMAKHFSPDAQEAKVPWYSVASNTGTSDQQPFLWSFTTPYAYSPDGVKVLWMCNQVGTNDLLAWSQATWDEKNKVFTHVTWGMTTKGAALVAATKEGNR